MDRFRTISAATLTAFGLVIGAFVAIPTQSSAEMTANLTPAERVDSAFAGLASLDPMLLAFSTGVSATRTVLIGYQDDITGWVLLRKPGM